MPTIRARQCHEPVILPLALVGPYVLLAMVTVRNLPLDKIETARHYALAEGRQGLHGAHRLTLIAVTALLSTASAISATLHGA